MTAVLGQILELLDVVAVFIQPKYQYFLSYDNTFSYLLHSATFVFSNGHLLVNN